jgi:hypothetical protein
MNIKLNLTHKSESPIYETVPAMFMLPRSVASADGSLRLLNP